MSIAKRRSSRAFTPILKWDARIGVFYLQDRVQNDAGEWENEQRNINEGFSAIIDMANGECGWVRLVKGSPPDLHMVPLGQDHGDPPSPDHQEGVRLVLQLEGVHAETGPRELISTAAGFWIALDKLHDGYLAGVAEHPGMLPVVSVAGVRENKNKTSIAPIFRIDRWTQRPAGLPLGGIPKEPASGKTSKSAKGAASPRQRVDDGMNDEIPF